MATPKSEDAMRTGETILVSKSSASAALQVAPTRRPRKGIPNRAPGSVDDKPFPVVTTGKKSAPKRNSALDTEPLPKCLRPSPSAISKSKPKRTPKPTSKFNNFQLNMPSKGGLRGNQEQPTQPQTQPAHNGFLNPLVVHVIKT